MKLKINGHWTYKNPVKNLSVIKTVKLVAKLDKAVKINDTKRVGIIIFLLPMVSAKNPQKYMLVINPIRTIPLKTPLSCVVRCNSHATGIIKLIPIVSRTLVDKITPDMKISR